MGFLIQLSAKIFLKVKVMLVRFWFEATFSIIPFGMLFVGLVVECNGSKLDFYGVFKLSCFFNINIDGKQRNLLFLNY